MPFAWTGVQVDATGATAARVAITTSGADVSVRLSDTTGAAVASVASLTLRPVSAPRDAHRDALYRLDWIQAAEPANPAGTITYAVLDPAPDGRLPGAARYPNPPAIAEAHDNPDPVIAWLPAPGDVADGGPAAASRSPPPRRCAWSRTGWPNARRQRPG